MSTALALASRHSAWEPEDLGNALVLVQGAGSAPDQTADPVADAYALGFEEGRREGEVAEQARLRTAVRSATDALDVLRENEERWSGAIEENIAALAVVVARHVLEREIASDSAVVDKLVRRALAEFPIDQPVRIRANPNDLAILQAHGDDPLTGPGGAGRQAHWIGDARIAPGGCVVEGREKIIDGRVDTALERAYRRLTYNNA